MKNREFFNYIINNVNSYLKRKFRQHKDEEPNVFNGLVLKIRLIFTTPEYQKLNYIQGATEAPSIPCRSKD